MNPSFYPKSTALAMTADKPGTSQDQARFEEVFLEHWAHVYRVLMRLTGDHAEAEDLSLETFLRFYRQPHPQDPSFNLGGWLQRVAVNLGLDALRKGKRRQDYEQEGGREILEEHPQATPADLLVLSEEQRQVRQVLSRMKPRQAQLLILRHSGLSYKEIAGQLNISAASVGPLLLRAEKEFERRYRQKHVEET
jgi:RNA polymerase sigma factor (sigma-70 family)